jgi:hypothetical protein
VRRYPQEVVLCLGVWLALSALVCAIASVPAFSPPWHGAAATPQRFAVIQFWWPCLLAIIATVTTILLLPASRTLQVKAVASFREALRLHHRLAWLLLAAALLRFVLVMRGGQYFDWDEVRYGASATWMFAYLSTGHFSEALDMLLRAPDHPGFRIVGLVPAFFHVASAWPTGLPITEMRYPTGEWLPAFVLSLASVCVIGLTYALATRAGASRRESLLAAFLMFASTSVMISTQHFFPYDTSLALFLFALWIGMRQDGMVWRSLVVGLLCGFAFLTYEGFWLMAAVVGGCFVFRRPRSMSAMAVRSGLFAAGAALFPLLLIIAGHFVNRPFLQAVERFSQSAVHGDFSEGWSLPWAYLWHTEHLLLFVYVFGVVVAIVHAVRRREDGYIGIWLSGAAAVYLGLIVSSNLLHRWVVYDRLVRQMLPFVCLAAAAGIARVHNGKLMQGRTAMVLYGVIALLFAVNVAPLMTQRYPRDIARDVIRQYGAANVRLDTIVAHSDEATVQIFLPLQDNTPDSPVSSRRYVLLNAKDIWVPEGAREATAQPAGTVLFALKHPRQLAGLQYHGYRPEERAFLRSLDLSIKLIDTQPGRR